MTIDCLGLLAGVRPTALTLARGEALFSPGETAAGLYLLDQGRLALFQHAPDGSPVLIQRVRKGEIFAETGLFASHQDYAAVAERPCRLKLFPKRMVLLHLASHPELNLGFSAYLARRLFHARARAELMRLKSARERVLGYFALVGGGARDVTLTVPLTDMATEIGLTHEALYRTLRILQDEGVLDRLGRRSFTLEMPKA